MKTRLVFLAALALLVPMSFAASWEEMSALAITSAIIALGMIFAVGYALNSSELKMLAQEELVQVGATVFMLAFFALLISTLGGLHMNSISAVDESLARITAINSDLGGLAMSVGREGSKEVYCSFSAVAFGIRPCMGMSMLQPPIATGFQFTSAAMAELSGIKALMGMVNSWIFAFFFPLGMFLRTFKYSRGAGALLMAFGISAYILLPFTYVAIHSFVKDGALAFIGQPYGQYSGVGVAGACSAYDVEGFNNENNAVSTMYSVSGISTQVVYYALLDATLSTVVSLTVMLASTRYLLQVFGAEVDVQALGRMI